MSTPRYLVPFDSRRSLHRFADVLVIGGGLAGLRAANAVPPDQSVLVITKDVLRESNSHYAQGGIAGVLDPEDCFDSHVADTLAAGGNLCHRDTVEMVVHQGPQRIEELIRWGTRFDTADGELSLGREGGHSFERIVHAHGDATGAEIMRAVRKRTKEVANIDIWENAFTIDLLTYDNRCRGALIQTGSGNRVCVWAKETILCTGGAGQVYRESTNPAVATGDGFALAYRAGVEMRDMEFVQFHPTVLYIAGSSRSLITEAIRGEGAYLVDVNGHRFMPEYDERLELAPRDIVSQSIIRQMTKTKSSNVYLDLSHLDADHVRRRFPGIAEACRAFGLDIATDRIPVRPGAHYVVGGVTVDRQGQTSLPGLWAAGEVTSSGLHGANRLASNSLLEGLVYGAAAGEAAARSAAEMPSEMRAYRIVQTNHRGHDAMSGAIPGTIPGATPQSISQPIATSEIPFDISDVRVSIKALMGRLVSVERDEAGLREAVQTLASFSSYVMRQQLDAPEGWELQNLLVSAELIAKSALARRESRGVHFRSDFPARDDDHWRRHLTMTLSRNGGHPLPTEPLPPDMPALPSPVPDRVDAEAVSG